MDTGSVRIVTTDSRDPVALVVGGEQLLRRGIMRYVEKLGFETTSTTARSLEEHSPEEFDLVVALIDLDSLDGYSILEALTRNQIRTPVVVVGRRASRGKVVEKLLGWPLAYLTLPVMEPGLRDAIERVLAPVPKIEDAPTQPYQQPWERPDIRIAEVIEALREGHIDLPTIGPIAVDLQRLIQRPTAGVEETIGIVQQDPVVASAVLRLANSSRHRGVVPITTLANACLRLGNKTVVALAQEALLRDLFALGGGPVQQLARAMWESVIVTSQGAKKIALEKGIDDAEEVQVAALFHNLGELVLLHATAGLYRDARRWEDPIFIAAVGREISRHHEEVGGLLLRSWGIDDRYIHVAEHHHAPHEAELPERDRMLCHLVQAAWAGSEQAGFGWRLGGRRVRARHSLEALNLTEPELHRIFDDTDTWLAACKRDERPDVNCAS